jgi:hypothetical protein
MKEYTNDREEIVRMYLNNGFSKDGADPQQEDVLEYELETLKFESERDAHNVCRYINQLYAGKYRPSEGIYALVQQVVQDHNK